MIISISFDFGRDLIVIQRRRPWDHALSAHRFERSYPDGTFEALNFAPSQDSKSVDDSEICTPFFKAQDDLKTGLIPFTSSTANTSCCTIGNTTILAAAKLDMLKDIYLGTPAWLYLAESKSDCYKATTTGESLEDSMLYLRRICNIEVLSNALTTYKGYVISTQPARHQTIIV